MLELREPEVDHMRNMCVNASTVWFIMASGSVTMIPFLPHVTKIFTLPKDVKQKDRPVTRDSVLRLLVHSNPIVGGRYLLEVSDGSTTFNP
jgi:hypothetical protein